MMQYTELSIYTSCYDSILTLQERVPDLEQVGAHSECFRGLIWMLVKYFMENGGHFIQLARG